MHIMCLSRAIITGPYPRSTHKPSIDIMYYLHETMGLRAHLNLSAERGLASGAVRWGVLNVDWLAGAVQGVAAEYTQKHPARRERVIATPRLTLLVINNPTVAWTSFPPLHFWFSPPFPMH